MQALGARLGSLPGQRFGTLTVAACDDFAYTDPVDGSVTAGQGVRILFAEDARAVFRLSGTGTVGATLRVYLERFEPDPARHAMATVDVLAPVVAAARSIAEIERHTGRAEPSVVT
jgi:phosphoglucomutase